MYFILVSSWKVKAMKKLLAILSVAFFASQASALDFDEWVGEAYEQEIHALAVH